MDEYFGLDTFKVIVKQPFVATGTEGKFDVLVNVTWWWIHRSGWSYQTWYFKSTPSR